MKPIAASLILVLLFYIDYVFLKSNTDQRSIALIFSINVFVMCVTIDWFNQHKYPVATGTILGLGGGAFSLYQTYGILASSSYEPGRMGSTRAVPGETLIRVMNYLFGYTGAAIAYLLFSIGLFYFAYFSFRKRND